MIYFDEAGNSGSNLLDINQPTFLLLSHDFTNEETKAILAPLMKVCKADELHFKKLKKYSKLKKALLDCINHPFITYERTFHYVAHKDFLIVCQIVDKLVEVVFYNNDMDIYKGGVNLSTSNLIYIMGTISWDKMLFKDFCAAFVKWMRYNSYDDAIIFYDIALRLYHSIKDEEEKPLVGLVLASKSYINGIMASHDKFDLDPMITCFIFHCEFWAKKYKKPFDVIVDTSKQISYWEGLVNFLTETMPNETVGYGSRKFKYPLLIKSIKQQDSASNLQIQLSDIFASSLNYAYSNQARGLEDEFSKSILKSNIVNQSRNGIWPTNDMTPEDLDMVDEKGLNPLDFFADIALKNPEAYNKINESKK